MHSQSCAKRLLALSRLSARNSTTPTGRISVEFDYVDRSVQHMFVKIVQKYRPLCIKTYVLFIVAGYINPPLNHFCTILNIFILLTVIRSSTMQTEGTVAMKIVTMVKLMHHTFLSHVRYLFCTQTPYAYQMRKCKSLQHALRRSCVFS